MTSNQGEKLRVGILMGGLSSEREISLESGRHVYNSLDPDRFEAIPIFIDKLAHFWVIPEPMLWLNTTADISDKLSESAERLWYEDLKERVDFAFLALHGKYVEDGCLQGLLELLDVPYNGSGVLASAIGMDKYLQGRILQAAGLQVPKHIAILAENWTTQVESILRQTKEEIGYPCIVKPTREGCSTALAKVKDEKQLQAAIEEALRWDNVALVEEFFGEGAMEITTTVMGNDVIHALLPSETPAGGDYLTVEEKFLPGAARMITPPRLPEDAINDIRRESEKAYKAVGCRVYARIDAFWTNHGLVILEANTLPGITPSTCVFHQAAEEGMSPQQFFSRIVDLSLEAHQHKIGPL